MRGLLSLLSPLALAALFAACSKDATQIVVVVDSDMAVPSELAAVRAIVRWEGEAGAAERRFDLSGAALGEQTWALPISFGVGAAADVTRGVTIEVHAIGPAGGTRFVRRAVTGFRENQTLLLPMFLARGCRPDICRGTDTCTEVGCVPEQIDPSTLLVVQPGTEFEFPTRTDGGLGPDAGVPTDSGVHPDAAVGRDADVDADAAPSDGGEVGPCSTQPNGARCGPGLMRCCGGVCVDTDSTANACGEGCLDCGPNAECSGGTCGCTDPLANCDAEPGCETDVRSNTLHCGRCDAPCAEGTSCINRTCTTCREASECMQDTLDCTGGPECDNGTCSQPLLTGWCLIDGVCHPAGQRHPTDFCLVCDPQRPAAWSVNAGASCDDGQFCTAVDTCDTAGRCVGSESPCTSTAPACVSSTCSESGGCASVVQPGWCAIGNACHPSGTPHPSNQCLGCDPARSQTDWSVRVNAPCSDGLFCTATDRCNNAGACVGAGTPCTNRVCGNETCNEAQDRCTLALNPGWCFIGGACVSNGEPDPANICWTCQPNRATNLYTVLPDGASCGIANICCGGECILLGTGPCLSICPPVCPVGEQCDCDQSTGNCACCPVGQTCF